MVEDEFVFIVNEVYENSQNFKYGVVDRVCKTLNDAIHTAECLELEKDVCGVFITAWSFAECYSSATFSRCAREEDGSIRWGVSVVDNELEYDKWSEALTECL